MTQPGGVFRGRVGTLAGPPPSPHPGWQGKAVTDAATMVQLMVCTTCRVPGSVPLPDGPRDGAALLSRLAAVVPVGVVVRGVECLSNCDRGCTVALGGAGRWTYVYGDIDPARDVAAVVEGAARYAATADGLVPWRERPEHFRKHCIARVPPLEA